MRCSSEDTFTKQTWTKRSYERQVYFQRDARWLSRQNQTGHATLFALSASKHSADIEPPLAQAPRQKADNT